MRRLLLALALLVWATAAHAVVAFDSKQTVACTTTGASPLTLTCTGTGSPTVGSGSNRALAVMVVWTSTGANPTAIVGTWNTIQPLGTILGASAYSGSMSGGTGIFCLANPASGNNTLTITATGSAVSELHSIAFSVTGADQTTPCQNYQGIGDQATSATPTIAVVSAVGNIPFAVIANNNVGFNSCSPTQLLIDIVVGPNFGLGGAYGVGAATTNISCSLTGSSPNQVSGADFKAAGGGGPTLDVQSLPMTGFGN